MATAKEGTHRASALRTILGVAACKAARVALRVMKRGGTALPGKAAMKFDRDILRTVSDGMEVIVVTGTNGKTTTCRMIEHALAGAGLAVLSNRSGANLLSGVTAEFVCEASWLGRPRKKYAVIECDEGALKQVLPLVHAKVIVVTNPFRDQLDRYGEVMHTLEAVRAGIERSPESILCLNADCSLTASLAGSADSPVPNPVVWYGMDIPVGEQEDAELSDAAHCIRCGTRYEYDWHTYAHLGGFRCPNCGYRRPDTQVGVKRIVSATSMGTRVRMAVNGEETDVAVNLPATYNVYNAAAAMAAVTAAGHPAETAVRGLADVRSSFGRMENFDLGGVRVQMILVKNPAGCNQALAYLASIDEEMNCVFCLNDRTADGHDVSWIWDADYEILAARPNVRRFYVAGDRAEDMRLRLKYADVPQEKIELTADYEALAGIMKESSVPVFALPNYTSMLALRAVLSEETGSS